MKDVQGRGLAGSAPDPGFEDFLARLEGSRWQVSEGEDAKQWFEPQIIHG